MLIDIFRHIFIIEFTSKSDPLVISADILFINRANVTFFSNFGSDDNCRENIPDPIKVDDVVVELSLNVVSLISSESCDVLFAC